LTWGFRPAWLTPGKRRPPIHARPETVATSGLFKTALGRHRAIVPASGFFEFMWTI
jgi:putative SOS response-associated peptidase YedK